MIRRMQFSAFAVLGLIAASCGSSRAVYKYQLKQVARGNTLADESRNIQKPLVFENPDFKIAFSPGPLTFYFRIDNKAQADLQINFAKSYLISPAGNAFTVVHPGNSALSRGDDFVTIPVQIGIDTWVRPGQKQGENNAGLAGSLAPGFDTNGFFPISGDAAELKKEYAGKTAIVMLNISKAGKSENYRFSLQVTDITEE